MWAKISNSATSMACAACIAVAATLPAAGSAAQHLTDESVRLAAITDIDAFSAIPFYMDLLSGNVDAGVAGLDSINGIPGLLAFLGGNPNLLLADDTNPGYDALSAIDVFFGDGPNGTGGVFTGGGIKALANYDALSAIPSYVALAQATSVDDAITALGGIDAFSALPVFRDVATAAAAGQFTSTCTTTAGVTSCTKSVASALGGYDALSALDTFFGDGPDGKGGVFTAPGGGIRIDALAPNADGSGGYAALSALPVFFGTANGPFGAGVFTGGGLAALDNYDALSGIPAYLNLPPQPMAATTVAPNDVAKPQLKAAQPEPAPATTTPSAGSSPVKTFVAALPKPSFTPPTPPAPVKEDAPTVETAAATTPDTGGNNMQNVERNSQKFTPKGIGGDPFLFGSGNKGPDNGISGWGSMLKKAGIGGGGGESGGTQ